MNFEELVNIQEASGGRCENTPIGVFQKKRIERKYENALTLKMSLAEDAIFMSQLRREVETMESLQCKSQLHFSINEEGTELKIDAGNFISIAQFVNENPAICTDTAFIDGFLDQIVEWGSICHPNGIYHVCFSPHNVFINRKTNKLALISHGSFYLQGNNLEEFYKGYEDYIAPEILSGGTIDERCDVFSVGKLFAFIFGNIETPPVYSKMLTKATEVFPEDRYDSLSDMKRALKHHRTTRRSIIELCIAAAVALLIVGIYYSFTPDNNQVEYVKPAPKDDLDEILSEYGFDPVTAMTDIMTDTTSNMTPEKEKELEEYRAKAAKIFQRRFAREADRILSGIYTKKYSSGNARSFVEANQSAIEELMKLQVDIAAQTGIDPQTSQSIAAEVIEQIANEKQKALTE